MGKGGKEVIEQHHMYESEMPAGPGVSIANTCPWRLVLPKQELFSTIDF